MEYFEIETVNLEYLYSCIYIPNILLSVGASFIVNKFGLANTGMVCQMIIISGMLTCLYGVQTKKYAFVMAGRAIYGVGCEVTYVA
jgi:fucose permease